MTTTIRRPAQNDDGFYAQTTLLELVSAMADGAESDAELIADVEGLMADGRARLVGHFTEADFGRVA